MIDTHCHLTKKFFPNPTEVVARAKEAGVEKMICVGTNLEDSINAVEVANNFPEVFASVGIHPEETCDDWEKFEKLISQPKVVAVGECGLDYKIGRPGQKDIFLRQIDLAKKYHKPLIVHCRQAQKEITTILHNNVVRGVLHCFAGGMEVPENFYVSFAGNITFKNRPADQQTSLKEVAWTVPLDRLLLETDAPFLAPEPLRGSQNEPKNVKIIASLLSQIKNVDLEELERITTRNAEQLFHFPVH
jgi:TatD DNase family protein